MAKQALQSARAAMGSDPQRAARFAHQAELDARLTWGMTDSQILRHDAVQIAAESERCSIPSRRARSRRPRRTSPIRDITYIAGPALSATMRPCDC